MRVYFEKPRTTTGWKGMINDPHLDGSGDVNAGLHMARGLLLEVLVARAPDGQRVPRPDHAAVHLGRRRVGGDRRAHDREPDPSPARVGPLDAGRLQERHRRQRRHRGGRRPRRRVTSCFYGRHAERRLRRSCTRAGTRTRTSSCGAGARRRTTTQLSVESTLGALRAAGLPGAAGDRRLARQQRQGPEPPAGRGRRRRRPDRRRQRSDRRGHARVVHHRRAAGARAPASRSCTASRSRTAAWAGRRRRSCSTSSQAPSSPARRTRALRRRAGRACASPSSEWG